MSNKEFINICTNELVKYYNAEYEPLEPLTVNDIYNVWYCKTLQNHKGLFGTFNLDGKYYEMTYNGDKDELYFDEYKIKKKMIIKPNNNME